MNHDPSHPRPFLQRRWTSLDGRWAFSLTDAAHMDREIVVPFAPETPASGIAVPRVDRCWYGRRIDVDDLRAGARAVVHFGAVDRHATVRANGETITVHEGGYSAFGVDVTDHLRGGAVDLTVEVHDDPSDLEAPRGKQDWLEEPHGIWYPRTTGIWRSVWLERVPATHVDDVTWRSDIGAMTLTLTASVAGPIGDGLGLHVRVRAGDRVLVDERRAVLDAIVEHTMHMGDGGFADREALPWWPRRPVVLDVDLALVDAAGAVVDEAYSYTALRSVDVRGGRVALNGRPYPLRLVLDQGYWPQTGATPPDVDALRRDIELTRALGFNGVRKHQKVEDARYMAHADRLGLLVWVEQPSVYRFTDRSARRLVHEWADTVRATRNHASVIAWVPINESWGVPAVEGDARQRALLDALGTIARAFDGTRPVSVNDGWETAGGDIVGIHDYTQDAAVLAERYGSRAALDALLTGRRADGRRADLDRRSAGDRAVMLSEFGGIALAADTNDGAWGYTTAASPEDLVRRYREQWAAVHASAVLAGACWTQLTDTYQEVNGLLGADRTPKAPLDEIAAATRGR